MDTLFDLEDNCLLFFTGYTRNAGSILKDQHTRTQQADEEMLANLHYVKELGLHSQQALEAGDTRGFAALMHEHWDYKQRRSNGMSNAQINTWYELGRANGALGGKLVGAGGGGFLLFYAEDHRRLRVAMAEAGLEEVRFHFDFDGTKVLFG
jgi:D-glycero-alpha-D-manno-heptose-7-phosphate kinase